ncbi:hypothetical protein P7C73_g3281, partial [Tremellales sp. Uapishka_1]
MANWAPVVPPSSILPRLGHPISRATPTLLSLPKEVLQIVASHLDIKTALSLVVACKAVQAVAESRIWRDVNLTLPPHYGEYPLIQPHRCESSRYCAWARGEARRAEVRAREAARIRIREIIRCGHRGDNRFSHVQKVEIMDRVGSNNGNIEFLALVHLHVKEIIIRPPLTHVFDHMWVLPYHATFLYKVRDFDGVPFPSLVKLDITLSEVCDVKDLILILRSTPYLRALTLDTAKSAEDADQDGDEGGCDRCQEWVREELPTLPVFNLKHLTVTTGTYSHQTTETLNDIIDAAVNLTHLTFTGKTLPDAVFTHSSLKHLDLRTMTLAAVTESMYEFEEVVSLVACDCIRDHAGERLEVTTNPEEPGIRHLVIRLDYSTPVPPPARINAFPTPPCETTCIHPDVLSWIAGSLLEMVLYCPSDIEARVYDVGEWEAKGIRGCLIRSFTHNEKELFHTRLYSRSIEREGFDYGEHLSPGDCRLEVTDDDGNYASKIYTTSHQVEWQDATHFAGYVVPMSVIRKMEMVEGIHGPWSGRGIEVSDAAWQVLEDWKTRKEMEDWKTNK